MTTGIIFDIKEFAIYDGPGLRCTVFFKGCPMHCAWCHNPEGIDPQPQTMTTSTGSRIVGQEWESAALAKKLLEYGHIFNETEGGITFSGGEPLMQAQFVYELVTLLNGKMHLLLQTSGFAAQSEFLKIASIVDIVYFDIKLADPVLHRQYTGKDNEIILQNLAALNNSGKPYRIRFPLIPGVTDTEENYNGVLKIIKENYSHTMLGLDLLSYNSAAGGKYQAVGKEYNPGFDEYAPLNVWPDFFSEVTEVKVV